MIIETQKLIYIAKVTQTNHQGIAAVVAVPQAYFSSEVTQTHISAYVIGAMDQAMRHNPILSFMDEWEFLEDSWKMSDIDNHTVVVI